MARSILFVGGSVRETVMHFSRFFFGFYRGRDADDVLFTLSLCI